jgi:hypothetical protein
VVFNTWHCNRGVQQSQVQRASPFQINSKFD